MHLFLETILQNYNNHTQLHALSPGMQQILEGVHGLGVHLLNTRTQSWTFSYIDTSIFVSPYYIMSSS